jgi:branched-chain amino acid transport system substrate-binding protein
VCVAAKWYWIGKTASPIQSNRSISRSGSSMTRAFLAEMGDFSSPCSMAASPVYERGGLVQFGFTNSHPDFTKGGNYMFSTSASQQVTARLLLDLAEHYGKRTAVLYVNNDWGKSSVDIHVARPPNMASPYRCWRDLPIARLISDRCC